MGKCESQNKVDYVEPHIISCDAKGRIINWKLPNSKDPELIFVQRIESHHSAAKGGVKDLIFAAPRKLYSKDNKGIKISWEFMDDGKIDYKKIESSQGIINYSPFAHCYIDQKTNYAFATKNCSIIQWKLPGKRLFKEWNQVTASPITTLYWNYDTQSLLVGDTGGFQKEFGAPESCYDEPKLIKDWGNIHDDKITCMFHQVHAKELFTVSQGPELKKWSLKTNNYGELLNDHSNLLHKVQIRGIVVNYYGNILFYCDGRFIRKLNLISGKYQESYDDHRFHITNLIMAYPENYKREYEERIKYKEEERIKYEEESNNKLIHQKLTQTETKHDHSTRII